MESFSGAGQLALQLEDFKLSCRGKHSSPRELRQFHSYLSNRSTFPKLVSFNYLIRLDERTNINLDALEATEYAHGEEVLLEGRFEKDDVLDGMILRDASIVGLEPCSPGLITGDL